MQGKESRLKLVKTLLGDPNGLKMKRPFTRGAERIDAHGLKSDIEISERVSVSPPRYRARTISVETYMRELDPYCHDVLFDSNLPSFCVKLEDGNVYDVKYKKVAIPLQRIIKAKQVLHLTGNPMEFTMMDTNPNDEMRDNFTTFKQYWNLRNQDGMKTKMVDAQKSFGDAGLLYYFDYKGRIKSRLLSYDQGYVLCPHNDANGDRVLESVYYISDNKEYIDSYDDEYMYRCYRGEFKDGDDLDGWIWVTPVKHGFKEIPLITKRGKVAWDDVQTAIEGFETLYNIFLVVQKRFGNGMLYIKGKFKDEARKIAGSIVLNDTSMEGKGDAKFLTPPTPQNMIDTMNQQLETIQLGSKTTFVLPKDIKASGDISGLAVQLTRELDILSAEEAVIDWQNVADKMTRLFKHGLACELVNTGVNPKAMTEFESLNINGKFKVWRPFNEYEFNQMVTILKGAGVISRETAIEVNTISKPDEKQRIAKEEEEDKLKVEETLLIQNKEDKTQDQKQVSNSNNQVKEEE